MPVKSAKQYGMMQAAAHGTLRGAGPSEAVAKEFIAKTSPAMRAKFAREIAKKRRRRHGKAR